MKNLLFFTLIILLFSSCKKEEQYNPDEHIVYTHWYKVSGPSADTLYSVYFPTANIGYCTSNKFQTVHETEILKTVDGGSTWTSIYTHSPFVYYLSVFCIKISHTSQEYSIE